MNTLFLAATTVAMAIAAAGSGVAQTRGDSPGTMPATPATNSGMQPAPPATPNATTGSAANTSASDVTVGQMVNDNTGVAVGPITALTNGASGMATIKMGDQSFQVPASNIYMKNGAATINLTKAQLQAQLPKPPA